MAPQGRQRSSVPALVAVYLSVGLAIRFGQVRYVRSINHGHLAQDPLEILATSGSPIEKATLIFTWWVLPALTCPLGVLGMVWGMIAKK